MVDDCGAGGIDIAAFDDANGYLAPVVHLRLDNIGVAMRGASIEDE